MKYHAVDNAADHAQSPPSRGAWIEIRKHRTAAILARGRPPRGGRGLKCDGGGHHPHGPQSPPSRGAWIEISGA